MAELEAEVVKLRADLAKSNAFAGLGDDMTGVTEVSVAQFSAVRARLLDAEKIKAQAEARIISLEDELKQYNQVRTSSLSTAYCSSLHTPTNTPTQIQTNVYCPVPVFLPPPIPTHPSTCATPP